MAKEKIYSLLWRFARGGVAGAVSAMVAILGSGIYANGLVTLADLQAWYVSLIFAGIVGFTSGILLTADKYFRME
jgi:hypothetical protein